MKKFITFIFIILSFSFFGCDLILDKMSTDLKNYFDDEFINTIDVEMDFLVQAFSEDSVVLQWSVDLQNARYIVYVKDQYGYVDTVEENYGKTNYFVSSDKASSYAIGILQEDEEVYRTKFIYPELVKEKGFPVRAEISSDGYLGVEFFYPSNVDKFYVKGEHENGKTYHTNKYTAEEMKSYMFPIKYEKNSHNNWITVIFIIDDAEYVSAKYYFDYSAHTEAEKNGSVTFYPSL